MRITREFVALTSAGTSRAGVGSHPCQGVYWRPAGSEPRTALIATHYNIDFSEHYLASYFAERDLGFLGWNTRFRGAEPYFLADLALVDIDAGVRWLRSPGRRMRSCCWATAAAARSWPPIRPRPLRS